MSREKSPFHIIWGYGNTQHELKGTGEFRLEGPHSWVIALASAETTAVQLAEETNGEAQNLVGYNALAAEEE